MYSTSISQLVGILQKEFGAHPVIATEIEFYLFGAAHSDMPAFERELRTACARQEIFFASLEKERGEEQFEIALPVEHDAAQTAYKTYRLKEIITESTAHFSLKADFAAKPLAAQPGSGLHVHVHLEDTSRQNLYWKCEAEMSDVLRYSLGGLLATMKDSMPVFAPSQQSRARFVTGSNAPTTISWGANNRTCALRLPDKPTQYKHIEHRVSGADADPELIIAAILHGIYYGLTHKSDPGAQIYGDAGLEMYGLPKLY